MKTQKSLLQLQNSRVNHVQDIQEQKKKMSIFLTFLFIVGVAVAADTNKYTTKFDDIDVDAVIRSERLTNNYVGCLLGTKPCTPDAAELKKNLPDALATDCSSCSAMQKKAADKLSHHLIDNKPKDWKLLEEKYDPTGAYRSRYLEEKSDKKVNETS